jgi:hypothetical protein
MNTFGCITDGHFDTECCIAGSPLMHIAEIAAIFPDIVDGE